MESGDDRCVVASCCCGCSLRSGSLAIGILSLIGGLINGASAISVATSGDSTAWGTFASSVIGIIFSIMLLYGIQKANRGLIMIWVWVNIVLLIINVILAIILVVLSASIVIAVVLLISCALTIYFIIVIRSYALTL